MNGIESYYWDSCIFICLLSRKAQDQRPKEFAIIGDCYRNFVLPGRLKIITSTVVIPEVLACKLPGRTSKSFDDLLALDNVDAIDADEEIMRRAHDLRNWSAQRHGVGPVNHTITTPDAIHLATAIRHASGEMWTFDEKGDSRAREQGLIPLSGPVLGRGLVICPPSCSETYGKDDPS